MVLDIKRHKNVFDPSDFSMPIHVIGCGGMGSRVAEGLVRMGLGQKGKNVIILHDHDFFDTHNLANQWMSVSSMYQNKVVATRQQMLKINPQASVITHCEEVKCGVPLAGLVFVCVDSMSARRIIVEETLKKTNNVKCVIETRMDAGVGMSHCFDPNNSRQMDCWRMYWYSDKETDNMQGCGGDQSIISSVYATTALALKQLEGFAKKKSTVGICNRVYQDFDCHIVHSEQWPSS